MADPGPDSSTSVSLLGRLRRSPADADAWSGFVRRYAPRIYQWCRGRGLQAADAEDVTQDVLLKLSRQMRTFAYDPAGSFRAWLRTLTHHAWYDHVSGRRPEAGGAELDTVAAREDLVRRLEEEFDLELLEEAERRVRARVEPRTWEAYRLTAREGLAGAEAAPRVGMQVAMVYAARSKVGKLLRQEVERLERDQPDGRAPA